MAEQEEACKLLSIQSHVVYGYVGNKSATFPLQLLGFDVSQINSVQFSNHTVAPRLLDESTSSKGVFLKISGSNFQAVNTAELKSCRRYKGFKGQVLHSEEVSDLYQGLKLNNLHHFSHVLTGYIGSSSFLEKVCEIIQDLRKQTPDLMYACDPVMGDNGKMYVKPELLPVYREKVVPLADIVSPNQYELELLSGMSITSEAEALRAMQVIHDSGCKTVVLSSTNLGDEGFLLCLSSSVRNSHRECYKIQFPCLPAYFTGTGDLFSAMLLAWMHKDNDLKVALEKTVACVQAVVKRTLAYCKSKCKDDDGESMPPPETLELRLIESKADIENPTVVYHAAKLSL